MLCQKSDTICIVMMKPERSCNQTAANSNRREVLVNSHEANSLVVKQGPAKRICI